MIFKALIALGLFAISNEALMPPTLPTSLRTSSHSFKQQKPAHFSQCKVSRTKLLLRLQAQATTILSTLQKQVQSVNKNKGKANGNGNGKDNGNDKGRGNGNGNKELNERIVLVHEFENYVG